MPKPIIAALIALVLAVCAAFPVQAAPTFPTLTGRVVDEAHLLSAAALAKLTALSAEHEKQTGNQLVVATVKSTGGYGIEDYANGLFRKWALGQKDKNNGVLILVSLSPKAIRIEVGYGLEGALTDAQSKLIIANTITPAFKKGDFDGGLTAAAVQVIRTLGGKPTGAEGVPDPPTDQSEGGILPLVFFIIMMLLFGRHLWPFLFLGALSGGGRGGGFGGGGFGGGGFGGGGFSGGGGSSGGGGASGSW